MDPTLATTGTRDADLIWHYTDFAGLLSILEHGSLWLSEATYMNDREELQAMQNFLRLVVDLASSHAARSRPSATNAQEVQARTDHARGKAEEAIDRLAAETVFIASFSQDCDLLSQWRAYCARGGAALGFDRKCLSNCMEASGGSLEECFYKAFPESTASPQDSEDPFVRMFAAAAWSSRQIVTDQPPNFSEMQRLAARYKHKGFCEEREIRAVIIPAPDNDVRSRIEVRLSSNHLKRYVPVNWTHNHSQALRVVRLAPIEANQRAATEDAVRILLARRGLNARVDSSSTPLRRD